MDNLKLPAYPVTVQWCEGKIGQDHQNGYETSQTYGFTKLEKAALVIAQGHVNNFDMGNHTPTRQFLEAFAAKCVCLAKAVLEEANK